MAVTALVPGSAAALAVALVRDFLLVPKVNQYLVGVLFALTISFNVASEALVLEAAMVATEGALTAGLEGEMDSALGSSIFEGLEACTPACVELDIRCAATAAGVATPSRMATQTRRDKPVRLFMVMPPLFLCLFGEAC